MKTRQEVRRSVEKRLGSLRAHLDDLLRDGRAKEAVDMAYAALVDALTATSKAVAGRKSETVDRRQLTLLLANLDDGDEPDDDGEALVDPDVEPEPSEEKPGKRKPHGRRRLPEELERTVVTSKVSDEERTCPNCGEQRGVIGHETSEVLEFVPAHFKVIRHEREKVACGRCRDAVVTAPPVDKVFERSMAGPGLLSNLVVSKYADHLPLNRLHRIYKRLGVSIATTTLCGWVGRVAAELEPIVERLWEKVLGAHVVQTDATGLKVLDRDAPGGSRLGSMWCHVGDYTYVVFRYAPTGEGAIGPWTYLAGREGYIQADASNVFDRLFNGKAASAIEVGCWAHARRKFHKLLDAEPHAARAIDYIQRLYRVEREAADRNLEPDAVRALRQHKSKPILDAMHRWLMRMRRRHPPRSAMGAACAYALRHWRALTRFVDDGALFLDNNLCELQIRDVAVGRKGYLFAGSDDGARSAAILYSIMRTCAMCGVDPVAYIEDVLTKLANGWPNRRIDDLLPDRWAQQAEQDPQPDAA